MIECSSSFSLLAHPLMSGSLSLVLLWISVVSGLVYITAATISFMWWLTRSPCLHEWILKKEEDRVLFSRPRNDCCELIDVLPLRALTGALHVSGFFACPCTPRWFTHIHTTILVLMALSMSITGPMFYLQVVQFEKLLISIPYIIGALSPIVQVIPSIWFARRSRVLPLILRAPFPTSFLTIARRKWRRNSMILFSIIFLLLLMAFVVVTLLIVTYGGGDAGLGPSLDAQGRRGMMRLTVCTVTIASVLVGVSFGLSFCVPVLLLSLHANGFSHLVAGSLESKDDRTPIPILLDRYTVLVRLVQLAKRDVSWQVGGVFVCVFAGAVFYALGAMYSQFTLPSSFMATMTLSYLLMTVFIVGVVTASLHTVGIRLSAYASQNMDDIEWAQITSLATHANAYLNYFSVIGLEIDYGSTIRLVTGLLTLVSLASRLVGDTDTSTVYK